MTARIPGSHPEEVLERWMTAYGTPLFRMCYVMLKDYALAQDAVQDTFIKAYKGLAEFQNAHPFSEKSWLNKIAVNTCKDLRRSAWFRWVDRKTAVEDVPQVPAETAQDRLDLMHAILALPIKYREVILLYYYENIKYEDIAKIIGISVSTVHSRLGKARQRLRMMLERGASDASE